MSFLSNGSKSAATVHVGEKGQIVIPKEMRDLFGIQPGDTLLLLADPNRGIAIPPHKKMETLMNQIFGGSLGAALPEEEGGEV